MRFPSDPTSLTPDERRAELASLLALGLLRLRSRLALPTSLAVGPSPAAPAKTSVSGLEVSSAPRLSGPTG